MKRIASSLLLIMLAIGCASPQGPQKVEVVQLVKSGHSWNGAPLPPYTRGTPEITILRITIPARTALPMHTHPMINAGVLLTGELTVTTQDGKVLHMKPYDPIVEVVDSWHYGRNDGDVPAEIIVFYAGEADKPITIKESTHAHDHAPTGHHH